MAGANIDPIGVINQITDNLRDRYDNGFPVLKEIIQNSDDARADSLIIGWSTGIENPDNPLLSGPGLFFINDAPLEEDHERGIRSIAESTKASSKSSVGKFGLGMKSLFHLCEAFFYQANNWREQKWAGEVFNPWGEDYRPEWHNYSNSDKAKIELKLKTIIRGFIDKPDSAWFLVWVPLRIQAQSKFCDNDFIINNHYNESKPPDFLLDEYLPVKISEIFPLLKKLNRVDFIVESNGSFSDLFHVELDKSSNRSHFIGEARLSTGNMFDTCKGKVFFESNKNKSEITFAGFEKLLDLKELNQLQQVHKGWPVSYQFDPVTKRPVQTLDKAQQHVAVVISKNPSKGQAHVNANWAVFLPLAKNSDLAPFAIDGNYDFNFYLHGYFFVDAGRKGIHGYDAIGEHVSFDQINKDEKRLRAAWNITLANQGTLNIIIDALEFFSESLRLSKADIEQLNFAIKSIFSPAHKEKVTANNQWVYEITKEKKSWVKATNENQFRQIPQPKNNDYERIWRTFPNLDSFPTYRLIEAGRPNLISKGMAQWSRSEIQMLFGVEAENVFASSTLLDYFLSFINLNIGCLSREEKHSLISPVVEKALRNVDLTKLSASTKLVKGVIDFTKANRRFALNINAKDQLLWNTVSKSINTSQLIPSFLDSELERSSASLTKEEGISILKALDVYLKVESETSAIRAAEALVRDVLTHLKKNPQITIDEIYEACSYLNLFKVENLRTNKTTLISINQLRAALDMHTLFIRSGVSDFGKAKEYVNATRELAILFITKIDADILFDTGLVPECSSKYVLRSIAMNKPPLGSELERKQLVTTLSGTTELSEIEVVGFRYILHGEKADNLSYDLWKQAIHSHDMWVKLWQLSSNINVPKWCLISDNLSGALNDDLVRVLKVKEISSTDVLHQAKDELPSFNYDQFMPDDFDELLANIDNESEWKNLPIHLFADGTRGKIDETCILKTSAKLPAAFKVKEMVQSKDPRVERQQLDWIGIIGPAKYIELALHQQNVHLFSEFILEQVNQVGTLSKELTEQTLHKLKKDAWLYTHTGQNIAPIELINFKSADWPELKHLCEMIDSDCFSISQLDSKLQSTEEKRKALYKLADHVDKRHAYIFKCAAKYPDYSIGKVKSITVDLIKQIRNEIKILKLFKGWRLISEFFENNPNHFEVSPAYLLQKEVSEYLLMDGLDILSDKSSSPEEFNLVREQFLNALCECEDAINLLAKAKLRTNANDFRLATELTRDVSGINPQFIVHDKELAIVNKLLSDPKLVNVNEATVDGQVINGNPSDVLNEYFSDWERAVPQDAIAIFLSILTADNEIENLANRYFKNKTLKGVLDAIQKVWITRAPGVFSGYPFKTVVSSNYFAPVILQSGQGRVSSLFGEIIDVPLTQKVNSLVVVEKSKQSNSKKLHKIQLRKIDLEEFDKAHLIQLLKESTETIIAQIYGQRVKLDELYRDLGVSNQLDIKLAKQMILEKIVPMLERLRIKSFGIGELLREYSQAQRYFVESGHSERNEVNEVLSKLQQKIQTVPELQADILNAVKHEIGFHAQYLPNSVPFELFQNADDAIGEKYSMEGQTDETPKSNAFWIKHDESNNEIDFYHWGREINYCKVGYVEGEGRFERDLEKMVSLNISDKTGDATGKFGLGFKSSLLVSDEPQIVSGDICFNIQAGILPVSSPNAEKLFKLSESNYLNGQSPTIIRLQVNTEFAKRTSEILSRFYEASGVLCVFSRFINTIKFQKETVTWDNKALSKLPNVYVGATKLPEKKNLRNQRVLHIETSSGQLLFRLRKDGFISLSDSKLSKFWVLNPLQEDLPAGFIVEANFQVDIGRSQLAKSNEANLNVMARLGQEFVAVLTNIFKWAEEDWIGLKNELEMDSGLTKERFWRSLWNVLTEGWPQAIFKPESKAVLFKQLFVHSGTLLDFYSNNALVPNELLGKSKLIALENTRSMADALLTATSREISLLPKLNAMIENDEIVSIRIGEFLEKVEVTLNRISVSDIIRQSIEGDKVFPDDAKVFGQLFNERFEERMSEINANHSQTEILKRDLKLIKFENKRGSWSEPNELIYFGDNLSRGEQLMADFAAEQDVLSDKYCVLGRKFFDFCQTTKSNHYFKWAHAIQHSDIGKQKSLIQFILLPEGASLFARLKERPPAWMSNQNLDPALMKSKWSLTPSEIEIFHAQWTDTQEDLTRRGNQRISNESASQFDASHALMNVYEWWEENKQELLPEYEKRLYPSGKFDWNAIIADDITKIDTRKAWLKLLYLGSCQTIGRTKEVQHRQAVNWFEENGWWDIFAKPDKANAQAWFKVIDEYLDYSLSKEQYRNWLQLLPIYRFSRDLDDYVELLWSSEQFLDGLDDFLSPGTSSALDGTGMSVPVLKSTLGIGINFVFRELIRNNVFDKDNLKRFGYVPSLKVREFFMSLKCPLDENSWMPDQSATIYDFIEEHLGEEFATFGGSFDIPFRILMEPDNHDLRNNLIGIGFYE